MKRSRTAGPGLKHIAYFEALAEAEERSPKACVATAGLLVLRLIDHWVLAGPVMVEPESVSVKSVRTAIMQIADGDHSRDVLLGVVNAMQTIREVDVQPVLPRLFAYATCLEKSAELKLAADVYETIVRFGDEELDCEIVIDSHLRLGYCLRMSGELDEAEAAYAMAGKIAKRQKETARMLRSRIGSAIVVMTRGNLPKAEEMLASVALESERAECGEITSNALHARSIVVQRRGDLGRAVCLAYEALRLVSSPNERDLILGDIGGYFVVMRRFAAARDALSILEATASTEAVRLTARLNTVALAARAGDLDLFTSSRARLQGAALTAEAQVNYLIESARGFRLFGDGESARESLEHARRLAVEHGFNRSIFEAEELLSSKSLDCETTDGEFRDGYSEVAATVEQELRAMALAVS